MHEILQTLSLAVTSIPSVTCVVAANCPKPMAALEVFPHFQVDFSSLKAKTLIAQLRFVPTSFGFWLLQMSCNSSTCLHMVHPPLPPRNHLQLDLEFPEEMPVNFSSKWKSEKSWMISWNTKKKTRKHDCRTAIPQFLPQFLQAQRVFHQPCYCECVEYTGLAPWPAAAVRLRFNCGFFSSRLSDCHK